MLLLALAAALMVQTASDTSGLEPYVLWPVGAVEPVRVLADPETLNGISFMALVDEPWTRAARWERIQRSTLRPGDGLEREESALREAWLNAEWPKHGGVQVTTRAGRRMWVLKDEQAWADKAQGLARAAYAPPPEPALDPALPQESSSAGPSAAQLWAPHAAVIAGAIALAAAVFMLLFRRPEQWQPLNSGSPAPRKR